MLVKLVVLMKGLELPEQPTLGSYHPDAIGQQGFVILKMAYLH